MNTQKYEADIKKLIEDGDSMFWDMYFREYPQQLKEQKISEEQKNKFHDFRDNYQAWYSESLELITQLLPSRVEDFVSYYKHKGARKEITYATYTIRDYLDGMRVTRGYAKEIVVGTDAAIPRFQQQLKIVKGLQKRFKSSLFDIKTLAQADLFDNELDAAQELNKNGYARAAGAVAGVVLESHLGVISSRHGVKIAKKDPTIADYNDALKAANILETQDWRKIQYLGDIRNKCDHKKQLEPTKDEVDELIEGVKKYIKTLF